MEEDSPLSITASVAGILTFVAAIFAFVYVRYNAIQHGRQEMNDMLESIIVTIQDSFTVAQAIRLDQPTLQHELISRILTVEITILTIFAEKVFAADLTAIEWPYRLDGTIPEFFDMNGAARERLQQALERVFRMFEAQRKSSLDDYTMQAVNALFAAYGPTPSWTSRLSGILEDIWDSIKTVVNLGLTPTMVRWYVVRDKVLEEVKRREILRSRLLFHQVSTANSELRVNGLKLEALEKTLEQYQQSIKKDTREILHLMTTNQHGSARETETPEANEQQEQGAAHVI